MITKELVLENLIGLGLLSDKKLIAITKFKETLSNLCIECTTPEYLVVYKSLEVSSSSEGFAKTVNIKINKKSVNITFISFRNYLTEIKEMNVDYISTLFENSDFLVGKYRSLYVYEEELNIFRLLVSLRENILYMDLRKLLHNVKSIMAYIVTNFDISEDFLFDYAQFLRYKRILFFIGNEDDMVGEAFVIPETSPLTRVRTTDIEKEDAHAYIKRTMEILAISSLKKSFDYDSDLESLEIIEDMVSPK